MGSFMISLLSASLFISGLAAVIWILEEKNALKKISSGTKAVIWFLLILGLLIPMKPSVFGPVVTIPLSGGNPIGSDYETADGSGETVQAVAEVAAGVKAESYPEVSESGFWDAFLGTTVSGMAEFFRKAGAFLKEQGVPAVLFGIWIAGLLISAAKMAYREYCFARAFKRWAVPANDPEILLALDEVCAAAGYRFPVRVYLCPFLTSPVLKGLICPSILIPADYKEYSDIRLILAHELTHARRQDLWMKAAAAFAALIHWFNPAVQLISKGMSLWCELACDETVLKGTDEETRIRYGMVLLNAAKRADGTEQTQNQNYDTSFSTPLFESARQIKKRVYACADGAHKRKGIVLIAISAVFILASGSIFQVGSGKAETVSDSYPYPFAVTVTNEKITVMNEKGIETVYEGSGGVWQEVPDGYIEISTKRNQDEITFQEVKELYEKAGADKRQDKLAVRFSDGGLLLIDPEETAPISPTVAGGAPWCIKAYVRLGDIWDLNPEVNSNRRIYDITGKILLKLADQNWADEQEFKAQAAAEIAAEFGMSEKEIILDISEISANTRTAHN